MKQFCFILLLGYLFLLDSSVTSYTGMFSSKKLIDFLSVWVLFCKPAKMTVNKVSPDPLFKTVPGNRNRLITHTRWQQEPKIYHFNYHLLRNHLRCVYKVRGGGGGGTGVNAINLRPGRVYISHIRRNFWAFTLLSLSICPFTCPHAVRNTRYVLCERYK